MNGHLRGLKVLILEKIGIEVCMSFKMKVEKFPISHEREPSSPYLK